MENIHKILLVDDEEIFNSTVKAELMKGGYEVDAALTGEVAQKLFAEKKYSVVLLDIYLPGINGFALCKNFREIDATVPIIMLSSSGEIDNKLESYKLGVDDYLVKPFHISELLAKLKVYLKRVVGPSGPQDKVVVEDLEIDLKAKKVHRGGTQLNLTAKEFALITLLAQNKGNIISKQEILEKVWGISFDTGTNSIEVYINFLRNKVDKNFERKLIYTKPGFGYYVE